MKWLRFFCMGCEFFYTGGRGSPIFEQPWITTSFYTITNHYNSSLKKSMQILEASNARWSHIKSPLPSNATNIGRLMHGKCVYFKSPRTYWLAKNVNILSQSIKSDNRKSNRRIRFYSCWVRRWDIQGKSNNIIHLTLPDISYPRILS